MSQSKRGIGVTESMGLAVGKPANLHHRFPHLLVEVKESVDELPPSGVFCLLATGASYGLGVGQLYKRLGGTPAAKHSRLSSFNSC
jgi:hypothetical protein